MEKQLRDRLRHHAWHTMPVLTVPTFPGLHVGKKVCGTGMFKEQLVTLDEHDFNIKHNELLNEYTNRTWLKENKAAQAIVQSMLAELKDQAAALMPAAPMPAAPMLAAPMLAAPIPPAPMQEPEAGPAPAPESAAAGPSAQGSLAAADEESDEDERTAILLAQTKAREQREQERERREQEQELDAWEERELERRLACEMPPQ